MTDDRESRIEKTFQDLSSRIPLLPFCRGCSVTRRCPPGKGLSAYTAGVGEAGERGDHERPFAAGRGRCLTRPGTTEDCAFPLGLILIAPDRSSRQAAVCAAV